jgi:6-phosphogluconate dehydrogenase
MVAALPAPRVVWVMVPAGDVTEATVTELGSLLRRGDILIDGGNSYYKDSMRRAAGLADRGVRYLDIGTSGGIWGLENGFCLMAGGDRDAFSFVEPLLAALTEEGGYQHVGPSGAGHYAKMVHNGIEYGLMQAYAEGYELLAGAELVTDVPGVIRSWRAGSVVRSWLLDLLDRALAEDPELARLRGWVADTGEGRWTVEEAVRLAVPAPAIAAALFARFASRQEDSPAMKAVAALREQFGGHAVYR